MDLRIVSKKSGIGPGSTERPWDRSVAGLVRKPTRTLRAITQTVWAWLYGSRRRLATLTVCIIAAWMGFHVISGPNGWMAYQKKKVEYRQLQGEVQQLQKENKELEQRVGALKSDPRAIEKEAREQFRYARPGELVYVLPEPKSPPVQPPAGSVAQKSGAP